MIVIFHQIVMIAHSSFCWWRLLLAVGLNFGVLQYLRVDLAYVIAALAVCFTLLAWCRSARQQSPGVVMLSALVMGSLSLLFALPRVAPYFAASENVFTEWYLQHRPTAVRDQGLEDAAVGSLGARLPVRPAVSDHDHNGGGGPALYMEIKYL